MMQNKSLVKLGGPGSEVEVDETFIGGKARFIHKSKRLKSKVRENNWGKAIVMGMLERDGMVSTRMIPDRSKNALRDAIADVIDQGSVIYTDELTAYPFAIRDNYAHKVVNHLEKYVDGGVHVRRMENFSSQLQR